MECSIIYRCECNNKTYPSMQSLKAHKKTKVHKSWEETQELRELKIKLTEKDNEIVNLTNNICTLKELNTILVKRIELG